MIYLNAFIFSFCSHFLTILLYLFLLHLSIRLSLFMFYTPFLFSIFFLNFIFLVLISFLFFKFCFHFYIYFYFQFFFPFFYLGAGLTLKSTQDLDPLHMALRSRDWNLLFLLLHYGAGRLIERKCFFFINLHMSFFLFFYRF